jgi:golgin subfamily B member 1
MSDPANDGPDLPARGSAAGSADVAADEAALRGPVSDSVPDGGTGAQHDDDDEPSIHVSFEELDGELALAGQDPSAREILRARQTVEFLGGILPRVADEQDAAQVGIELGEVLGWPLGAADDSLAALRDAYRRWPQSLAAARGYRKAALRAGAHRDLVIALEGEVKLRAPHARAVLECERAALLERSFANAAAARLGFQRALEHDGSSVIALESLERLALANGDHAGASEVAQRHAAAVTDGALKAELLARAARHAERAGDRGLAIGLAIDAQVHAPSSPSVSFVSERLSSGGDAWMELCQLRMGQVVAGAVAADEGWFDIGIIARYRLDDAPLAERAFERAAEWLDDDDAEPCLDELASLIERAGRWRDVITHAERCLSSAKTPARRAVLWQRVGWAHEVLGEASLAAEAYERALEEEPADAAALERAGRLFTRVGAKDRLLRMHRREVAVATSHAQAGRALQRAGDLLVEDEATLEEGIEVLRQALALLPGDAASLAGLERALRLRGDWPTLIDLFEYEIEVGDDPERRAWLLREVGTIAADRLGDARRAVTALRASLALAPGPPATLLRLAELLEAQGDADALVPVLAQLCDRADGASLRATALGRLAALHERRGALDDAVEAYRRALDVAPPGHPVFAAAGRAFIKGGRHDELLEVLAAGARDAAPDEQARWLWKAALVLDGSLERVDDAIDHLSRACALAPDSAAPRRALEAILRRERRWQELATLLGASPDAAPAALLEAAMLAEAVGDPGAVDAYARAVAAGCRLARLPFARLAAREGRWEELEAHYAATTGPPIASMHARYRAGEVAAERRDRGAAAVAYLLAAHDAMPESLAPLVALGPVLGDAAGAHELAAKLAALTSDRSTRVAALRKQAALHDSVGAVDDALAVRRELLELEPIDADARVKVELELERRSDRIALAELWRRAAGDPRLEPGLAAHAHASLGAVLEQLGLLRDAAQAYEASRTAGAGPPSRMTLLALRRIYDALGDSKVGEVLAELGARPPGLEQSLCLRVLAGWHLEKHDPERAAASLQQALALHPRDYDALNDLLDVAGTDAPDLCTDALLHAFELEEDPQLVIPLGAALAARLLAGDRHDATIEVVGRVLALAPDDLPALMLQAEVHARRGSSRAAAEHLWRVANHPLAGPRAKLEALRRAAVIHAGEVPDRARALAALHLIRDLGLADEEAREVERSVAALVAEERAG